MAIKSFLNAIVQWNCDWIIFLFLSIYQQCDKIVIFMTNELIKCFISITKPLLNQTNKNIKIPNDTLYLCDLLSN